MTRRGLTTRLAALERRRGRDPWHPLVGWIEVVRSGEEGRRDLERGAAATMYTAVRAELTRAGIGNASLVTVTVVSEGEGIAEASGRRWHFALADDGVDGTVATVTEQDGTCWAGSRGRWGGW